MINTHGSIAHVVDQFEATDLGAPFKVILNKCVKVVSDKATGEVLSYTIPDPDGLLRMVVLSRIMHPRKLFGADIKFLRKAVGLMQKEVAKGIDVTPEHLSKCEAGKLALSGGGDKLLRLLFFKTAIKHHKIESSKAKKKIENLLDKIFDDQPICAHDVDDEIVLRFSRGIAKPRADNDDDEPEYRLMDAI
ncbi:helix-turn-helix domain-containing protein [Sphingopyxis sp. PET50]|uniref:helix-turn-helix domain-containing protein n=1 Tax=Sphingopyxis sp. PET50 TaxID=2976533 RepID=UPI0021AFF471|nr:hypothetical protein [Sphingopyxis sp. PET50]